MQFFKGRTPTAPTGAETPNLNTQTSKTCNEYELAVVTPDGKWVPETRKEAQLDALTQYIGMHVQVATTQNYEYGAWIDGMLLAVGESCITVKSLLYPTRTEKIEIGSLLYIFSFREDGPLCDMIYHHNGNGEKITEQQINDAVKFAKSPEGKVVAAVIVDSAPYLGLKTLEDVEEALNGCLDTLKLTGMIARRGVLDRYLAWVPPKNGDTELGKHIKELLVERAKARAHME